MDAIYPGLSALNAFSKKLNATSNNVANSQTPGYKAVRVHMVAQKTGGVSGTVSRDLTPGPPLPPESGSSSKEPLSEGSNVDLTREMTDMVQTSRAYQANAKTISRIEETKGGILDIID